jgi:hypothetical protein
VVVVGLVVAIIKPWGNGIGPSVASAPLQTVSSTPLPTPSPSAAPAGVYNFLAFGTNEPPPGWELWPAGRLASFSFAMRIDMAAQDVPVGGPVASGSPPVATPTPVETPLGTPSAAGVPVDWPIIRIPRGSVLDLVGINQPLGYVVHIVGLTRIDADGSVTPVRVLLSTSPWPTHFTTFGYAPSTTEDSMAKWPAGHYRLDLTIDPGAVSRILDIVVEGPATEAGSGASSPSPGVSAAP